MMHGAYSVRKKKSSVLTFTVKVSIILLEVNDSEDKYTKILRKLRTIYQSTWLNAMK